MFSRPLKGPTRGVRAWKRAFSPVYVALTFLYLEEREVTYRSAGAAGQDSLARDRRELGTNTKQIDLTCVDCQSIADAELASGVTS